MVQKLDRNVKQRKTGQGAPSGFVLIATVALTVFLVTLGLGMINLSKSVSKRSSHDKYAQIAKSNARMAMMLALGELQKAVGPDQRVTAEANLLGDVAEGKRHWVGVWNSEQEKGEREADGEFLQWLVSSKDRDGVSYEAASEGVSSDYVQLVGQGSVNTGQEVSAQMIDIADDIHGGTSGRYAWWVGDEGVRARVDLTNSQDDIYFATQGTQRAALEVIDGFGEVSDENLEKLITSPSVSKVAQTQGASAPKNFHDITVHSMSLLTDPRRGGFKKDLTALFEMTDRDYEAIDPAEYADFVNENTPVSSSSTVKKGLLWHEDGVYGPTMDTLRNHYRMYKKNLGSLENPSFAARASFPNKAEFQGQSYNWTRTACVFAWGWGMETDPYRSEVTQHRPWWTFTLNHPTTRLLYGNMTPYLNRVLMYVSLEAEYASDNGTPGDTSDDLFDLQLKFQPVMFVHNPYNVSLRVEAMRYLKTIDSSTIDVFHIVDGKETVSEQFQLNFMLDVSGRGSQLTRKEVGQARFETRQPYILAPGEVKVFVPSGTSTWDQGAHMVELGNNFDPSRDALTLDLYSDVMKGRSKMWAKIQKCFQGVQAGTEVKSYLRWGSYDKEDFEIFEPERSEWNTVWSGLSYNRYNSSSKPEKFWPKKATAYRVEELQTITPFYLEDRFIKPAEYERYDDGLGDHIQKKGVPAFVYANPVASSDAGKIGTADQSTGDRMPGAAIYSNVTHGYMDFGDPGYGYLQTSFTGSQSTWGSANGADGELYTSVLEIPVSPLHSLGALQHVNLAAEATLPALAIGNSYPSMLIEAHSNVIEINRGRAIFDLAYLSNQALWDTYFFSSITPRTIDSSFGTESNPSSDIQSVIDGFVDADGTLGNTRMQFIASDRETAKSELSDFKTAAAHLGVLGGFNVNSTSIQAWRAFLSGYRNAKLKQLDGSEDMLENSAFPRQNVTPEGGVENPRMDNENSWSGFAKLEDSQIQKLAEEIVNQNKERAKHAVGNRPYLSMGQFVNRMPDGRRDQQQRGALQAAIDKSGVNESLASAGDFNGAEQGTLTEELEYEGDAKDVTIPLAASAPSFVLQSDVLQALGAAMTVRSDTFVIRTYGDAVDRNGKQRAKVWCEAVVQRVPTPVISDTGNFWLPLDKKLGRKLKLISFRWLSPDEV